MNRIFLVVLATLAAIPAYARDADGVLSTIILPNEGRCAVVAPGGSFLALARANAVLTLRDGDREIELHTTWRRVPGGMYEGTCAIPESIGAGAYDIVADGSDVNVRSVFVMPSVPEAYDVAHVAALRATAENAGALTELAEAIRARTPGMVVVSGSLTASGEAADFQAVLAFVRSLRMPVVVAPGPTDMARDAFSSYFGPPVYAMRYGEDAYLSVGGDVARGGEHEGPMYRARRAVRSARWSVGIASADVARWPMRTQLTLLVDDPLDFLLLPGGGEEGQGVVRWNTAVYLSTPDAATARWRMMRVEAFRPSPGEILLVGEEIESENTESD